MPPWADAFIVSLLATIVIASVIPARGAGATVFEHLSTAAVALLFFLHGARLSPAAAWQGLRHWQLHGAVLGCTYLLFPVLGFVSYALQPGVLTHQLYVGVMFLCILPSTVQSSIAFTSIARGNVAAAICSAATSNLLGVLLTPLLAGLILGSTAKISGHAVLDIVLELLVPVLAGQLSRRWTAAWITRHRRVTVVVDRGSILLVVYAAFSAGVVAGIWHRLPAWRLAAVTGFAIVLLAVVLFLTSRIGRALHFERADRIVLIFCGSKKSLATGLPLATILFAREQIGVVVLPLMIYHLIQLLVCAVLARRFAADGSAGSGNVAAAVHADGGSQRQIAGQALRATLGGRRVAEHRRPAARHVKPVRHHDGEVDDRHEDDEVDDRGDECAQVDALSVEGPAEPLAGGSTPASRVDERCDDAVRERLDQGAEGQRNDQADRDDHQLALHEEVLEALEHRRVSLRDRCLGVPQPDLLVPRAL